MEDVKQHTAPCFNHCLTIFLYDCLCATLPKALLAQFVFIDSWGAEHALNFAGGLSTTITGVSPGMGKLVFKGGKKDLADACGFNVDDDGLDKHVPQQICKEKELSKEKEGPLLVRKVVTFHDLSKGVDIEVADQRPCTTAYIRFQVGASDWMVHMAWMDNHSGKFHGAGHYGVMIVDGVKRDGLYADFGKYHMVLKPKDGSKDYRPHEGDGTNDDHFAVVAEMEEEFDMIRVSKPITVQFTPEELFADAIAEQWSNWNGLYGSEVMHRKLCQRYFSLKGPNHQWIGTTILPQQKPPYNVDGVLGWAGFRLKRGAYERMKTFIDNCKKTTKDKWDQTKAAYARHKPKEAPANQYDPTSFNCMTFGLCVYEAGANPNNTLKGDLHDEVSSSEFVDHPNDGIHQWIARSHDGGYFYDRQRQGMPTATAGRPQAKKNDIHREAPEMVSWKP